MGLLSVLTNALFVASLLLCVSKTTSDPISATGRGINSESPLTRSNAPPSPSHNSPSLEEIVAILRGDANEDKPRSRPTPTQQRTVLVSAPSGVTEINLNVASLEDVNEIIARGDSLRSTAAANAMYGAAKGSESATSRSPKDVSAFVPREESLQTTIAYPASDVAEVNEASSTALVKDVNENIARDESLQSLNNVTPGATEVNAALVKDGYEIIVREESLQSTTNANSDVTGVNAALVQDGYELIDSALEEEGTTTTTQQPSSDASFTTTPRPNTEGAGDAGVITVVETEAVATRTDSIIDVHIVLIVGATAAGLLIVLLVVVVLYLLRPKVSNKKSPIFLNGGSNRWDPQLLRPSQKSLDSFVFGSPLPSVNEMIKSGDNDIFGSHV